MTIKGKKKSAGRKSRASAPKPAVVHRKRPVYARRGVRAALGGALILVAGVVLGGALGRATAPSSPKLSDQGQKQVRTFEEKIDPILTELGWTGGSSFTLFPSLHSAVDGFEAGTISDAEFRKWATAAAEQTQSASDALNALDMESLVKGIASPTSDEMLVVESGFLRSVALHHNVADMLTEAANMHGKDREVMVRSAVEVLTTAEALFKGSFAGYQAIVGQISPTSTPAANLPQAPGAPVPSLPQTPPNTPVSPPLPGGVQGP